MNARKKVTGRGTRAPRPKSVPRDNMETVVWNYLGRRDPAAVAKWLGDAIVALKDTARLDYLLDWLGGHDDLEGSGIRDWNDNTDARTAIDSAKKKNGRRDRLRRQRRGDS